MATALVLMLFSVNSLVMALETLGAHRLHHHLGRRDPRAGLGDLELDRLARIDRDGSVGGESLARIADRHVIGALGAAQHHAGQHVGAKRQERQTEQGTGMAPRARMRLAIEGPGRD